MFESGLGKFTAGSKVKATGSCDFDDFAVAGRIGDNGDRGVVLCGCAHHGGSADVDLFDNVVVAGTGGHSFDERVEVDHHEVELFDTQLFQLVHVVGLAGVGEDACVDLRVERFDAPLEAFGESGQLFDRGYGRSCGFNARRGRTG